MPWARSLMSLDRKDFIPRIYLASAQQREPSNMHMLSFFVPLVPLLAVAASPLGNVTTFEKRAISQGASLDVFWRRVSNDDTT